MLKIGLTGGIGSGKSTVAKYFAELGATIIDADQIAKELIDNDYNVISKLSANFGHEILDANDKPNRKKLREIIFSNPVQREWLEKLLHPLIYQELEYRATQATSPYCILVIPLLFETNGEKHVDRTLLIDARVELQIARAMERDGISKKQAIAIINSQQSREIKLKKADDIIRNNSSLINLRNEVLNIHKMYLGMASTTHIR